LFPDYCLFINKANRDEQLSFVIIYLDEGGFICTSEAIKEVIEALSESMEVKNMGELNKLLEGIRIARIEFGFINQNYL
jgi:hypothetical protein